ncbi:MAG: beta-galactosidase [Phycisphaerales bacterium]
MPSITSDGHTLSVDGRRLWVVSGTMMFSHIDRSQWASRLRAACAAGFNTVEVPVVWSEHEPRQGKFLFDGNLDITAFLKLADSMGLRVIVRAGPYIGEGMDMGGLPPWLPTVVPAGPLPGAAAALVAGALAQVRSHHPQYLAFVASWISALCEKLVNQQVTGGPNRRGKGPIIAVAAEYRWLCGDDGVVSLATNTGGVIKEGTDYLREVARFLREGGINVPVIANHDLYHASEGQIEAWSGTAHLHANLRQLRTQRPQQPRFVMGLRGAHDRAGVDTWGHAPSPGASGRTVQRALIEALAAGAQFNVDCFAPGARLGFSGGKTDDGPWSFVTPGSSAALLTETGQKTERFYAIKRVATFASSFERVLCGLDPAYQPVTVAVDSAVEGRKSRKAGPALVAHTVTPSVVHATGSQGSVVFVFAAAAEDRKDDRRTVRLVLSDGSTLPVTLDTQDAGWVLLDTHLAGRATLDYCNLCAFALAGKSLVCFGPAGSVGLISINGSPVEIIVPEGDAPLIQEIEGIAVAVCNEKSIDHAIATADGVWFGVEALDIDGNPIPRAGATSALRLGPDGSVRTAAIKPPPKSALKITPSAWWGSGCLPYLTGDSPRFARIDKPATLAELGAPTGYGWYRLRVKSSASRRVKVGLFESADRIHLWSAGESGGVIGVGPGATDSAEPVTVALGKGETSVVMLADNLGRASEGSLMGEPKGVFGQVWEVSALKCPTPKIETSTPVEPLKFRSPVMGLQLGDTTDPRRLAWKFSHKRKTPVFVCVDVPVDDGSLAPGLVLLNNEAVSVLTPGCSLRLRLEPEKLKANNTLELAIAGDMEHAARALKSAVTLFAGESCVSEKADWGFAKWEAPTGNAWEALKKGAARKGDAPMWWKCVFDLPEEPGPVVFDTDGLSKGQVFVNGHNLGRYFTSTSSHKAVGPQTKLAIPESWLKAGAANEVLVFDEHGCMPWGCRVVSG